MNENDKNVRRKVLGTLFALCPRGQEASDAVDVYLKDTEDIPTLLFVAAVTSLRQSLEWPKTPAPGDIRIRAQKLLREQRCAQREEQRARELAEAYQNAMEPAEALRLLEELKSEGEPERPKDRIAHKLRCHALERVVMRDRSLLLPEGEVYG